MVHTAKSGTHYWLISVHAGSRPLRTFACPSCVGAFAGLSPPGTAVPGGQPSPPLNKGRKKGTEGAPQLSSHRRGGGAKRIRLQVELLTTAQDKLFSILKHDVFSLGRLRLGRRLEPARVDRSHPRPFGGFWAGTWTWGGGTVADI